MTRSCNKKTSLDDLIAEANRRSSLGVRPGLEVTLALLAELGNPHQDLACIHVAGTNGKGSVCAMLEALFLEAGLRTGLYTSPHLVRINERFRIEGLDVSDELLSDALKRVLEADKRRMAKSPERAATFFELTTVAAFVLFAGQGVQLAIIEVGMGGRWDATNVIFPLCSAITQVTFDHQAWLGSTIAEIAGEKAGIIKPGRPVVVGPLAPEAMQVARRRASEIDAPFKEAERHVSVAQARETPRGQTVLLESQNASYGRVTLPLKGAWQLSNLAVAVAVFEEVSDMIGLQPGPETVKRGLERTRWRARFEQLEETPPVWLDGAHNEAGMQALVAELRHSFKHRQIGLICGFLSDKDTRAMTDAIGHLPARCWTVTPPSERALSASECAALFRAKGVEAKATGSVAQALDEARAWALQADGVVVVAGSLYVAGEVLKRYE